MRTSGILLPITALPSPYGIGTLGKSAYDFVDFLTEAGQTYWQILPLGPTGYGDSPYQSFSSFAGNPYLIDLDMLVEEGLLTKEECKIGDTEWEDRVDYGHLYETRFRILRLAYQKVRGKLPANETYQAFLKENEEWLPDYALFRAIKNAQNGMFWGDWPAELKTREKAEINRCRKLLEDDIGFYFFLEYQFYQQYQALRAYAHEKGILIFGDLPIYVAIDSADAWSHPELFYFDEDVTPEKVAGVPPDAFSATGQLWGNPLYRWKEHEKTGYHWWISRVKHSLKLYDRIRIDHFRGFDEYYAVPYGAETALEGEWEQGPGMALFTALRGALGEVPIVAEDLGVLTPTVHALLKDTGYPGMKVVQFAFDGGADNIYLPYFHDTNSIVYTGTHDNDTLRGFIESMDESFKIHVKEFLGVRGEDNAALHEALLRLALMSRCDTAIVPLQDYLGIGSEGRINAPSTLGGNWSWRLLPQWEPKGLAKELKHMMALYGRSAG